jgi:hypothetical protein
MWDLIIDNGMKNKTLLHHMFKYTITRMQKLRIKNLKVNEDD